MPYVKTNWINKIPGVQEGTKVNAANMNKIEQGIEDAHNLKADIESPEFTGTPFAPTPPTETNSEQIATTAFVKSQTLEGQITTDALNWVASGNIDLPYKKDIVISGVSIADKAIIDFVLLSLPSATEAGITYQETYNGGVTLYASAVPLASVTFDYVVIKG